MSAEPTQKEAASAEIEQQSPVKAINNEPEQQPKPQNEKQVSAEGPPPNENKSENIQEIEKSQEKEEAAVGEVEVVQPKPQQEVKQVSKVEQIPPTQEGKEQEIQKESAKELEEALLQKQEEREENNPEPVPQTAQNPPQLQQNSEVKEQSKQKSKQEDSYEPSQQQQIDPKQIENILAAFRSSAGADSLSSHMKKLQNLLSLADSRSSSLNLHFGLGDHKGKSSLKLGLELKHTGTSQFKIVIDIKIKKKVELKQFIQSQLKRLDKEKGYNAARLCKIGFTQTDKILKVEITSPALQQHLQETISLIDKLAQQEEQAILKVEADIHVKNSIKGEEQKLQSKKFVKWLGEGVNASLKIEGNSKVVHHVTSPLAQIFPALAVIKSGQLTLKLKHSDNVDKWFQKLGIGQLAEETPNLREVTQLIANECLNDSLGWTGQLLRKSILFACNIPNERVCFDMGIRLGMLDLNCAVSVEACKQLGELFKKTTLEEFS